MQLVEIRTAVRERLGIDVNDAMAVNAVLTNIVNSAVRELNLMADWDWLKHEHVFATVPNQMTYTPPADWRATVRVAASNGNPLELRSPTDIMRLRTHVGIPKFYTVERGLLSLLPVPDLVENFHHTYIRTEPALVVDGNMPLCPGWMIDAIIVKAARKLCTRINNPGLLRQLQEEEALIMTGIRDEARRSRASMRVRARGDWG